MTKQELNPLSPSKFPELSVISTLVSLQEAQLPFHPDLRTHRTPLDEGLDWTSPMKKGSLDPAEVEESVAERRNEIAHHAHQVTMRLIGVIEEELQLSGRFRSLPPRIICSDYVNDRQAWSAGMDGGFNPISGSFFIFRDHLPARMDGRIRDHIGPVIHYDIRHLREPALGTYVEEGLHYLQWLYQTSPDTLDRVIKWRAVHEDDKQLKSLSRAVLKERGESIPRKGSLPADAPSWWRPEYVDLRVDEKESDFDKQSLASHVLFEACAELMRLKLGVTENRGLRSHFEQWNESGISAWNFDMLEGRRRPSRSLRAQKESSAEGCFGAFSELSFPDFVKLVEKRNGSNSLQTICDSSDFGTEAKPRFPADLSHFLGYGLGLKLFQSGKFNGRAGTQDVSQRFFSYLTNAVDRLESLKELVD